MPRLAHDRFAPVTRARTLAALREFAARIGRAPKMADVAPVTEIERGIRKHFGSLSAARKAAGLLMAPTPRKWTEANVIAELRSLHQEGVRLTRRALAARKRHDLVRATDLYGGMQVMRRRAGVSEPARPRTARTPWDDARVIAEIRQRHDDGEPLAYSRVPAALVTQGWKRFGSWRDAVTAAGFDYDQVCLLRRWSDDEIIDDLRALRRTQPTLERKALQRSAVGQRAEEHFGGLDDALRAAKIRRWPHRARQPAASLRQTVAALRARRAAGKGVTAAAVVKEDPQLARAVRRYFPAFSDALAAAGIRTDGQRRWSADEVIAELRKRHSRHRPMNSVAVEKDDIRLFKAAKRRFGAWGQVLKAAGVATSEGRGHGTR